MLANSTRQLVHPATSTDVVKVTQIFVLCVRKKNRNKSTNNHTMFEYINT